VTPLPAAQVKWGRRSGLGVRGLGFRVKGWQQEPIAAATTIPQKAAGERSNRRGMRGAGGVVEPAPAAYIALVKIPGLAAAALPAGAGTFKRAVLLKP
jgi:hypothetical protein